MFESPKIRSRKTLRAKKATTLTRQTHDRPVIMPNSKLGLYCLESIKADLQLRLRYILQQYLPLQAPQTKHHLWYKSTFSD